MTDSKLAFIFFEVGLILTLVSMVLGPFGIQDWSIACAAVACFMALAGIYLAMGAWESPTAGKPKARSEFHRAEGLFSARQPRKPQ